MQEIQMSRKAAAYKIHMDIMAAGEVAAEAFSTFCRLLKTMRDDKLYLELEYSSFEAYCENAVGITYRQAFNYIKVLENLGEENLNSGSCLGIKKLQLIAAAPAENRDKLLEDAKEMTTRQVEAAVKEYKEKLKAKDAELAKKQEALEKANRYADEHMMRARQAEKEVMDKEKSIQSLRLEKSMKEKEIVNLQQQLEQAKRNGDPSKVQELGKRITEYQEEIESLEEDKKTLTQEINNLRKQLKEKPIEVTATNTVEVIPDEVALAIYDKVARLYEGLERLTDKEIQVFAEQVDSDYYDEISEGIDNAIERLKKIKYLAYRETHKECKLDPAGRCGECVHADMDQVADEQLDDGKTLCTIKNQIVDFEDAACEHYKSIRG